MLIAVSSFSNHFFLFSLRVLTRFEFHLPWAFQTNAPQAALAERSYMS
jgi:hypothetical protein